MSEKALALALALALAIFTLMAKEPAETSAKIYQVDTKSWKFPHKDQILGCQLTFFYGVDQSGAIGLWQLLSSGTIGLWNGRGYWIAHNRARDPALVIFMATVESFSP